MRTGIQLVGFCQPSTVVILSYAEAGEIVVSDCELRRHMLDGIRVNLKAEIIFLHGCGDKIVPWAFINDPIAGFCEQKVRIMDYGFHKTEFDFFEPFQDVYFFFYNFNGQYRVDPQLLSHHSGQIQEEQTMSIIQAKSEEISSVCFTEKDTFLCVSTVVDQKLKRLLILRFKPESFKFQTVHSLNYDSEAFAKHPLSQFYYFQCSVVVDDRQILVCLQRNNPYKKLLYSFADSDILELKGLGNLLGKWKSGHFGLGNSLWVLQEQECIKISFRQTAVHY